MHRQAHERSSGHHGNSGRYGRESGPAEESEPEACDYNSGLYRGGPRRKWMASVARDANYARYSYSPRLTRVMGKRPLASRDKSIDAWARETLSLRSISRVPKDLPRERAHSIVRAGSGLLAAESEPLAPAESSRIVIDLLALSALRKSSDKEIVSFAVMATS